MRKAERLTMLARSSEISWRASRIQCTGNGPIRRRGLSLFFRVCGIKSFARGVDRTGGATVAVDTRCLDDVDVARLNVTAFDGKSR